MTTAFDSRRDQHRPHRCQQWHEHEKTQNCVATNRADGRTRENTDNRGYIAPRGCGKQKIKIVLVAKHVDCIPMASRHDVQCADSRRAPKCATRRHGQARALRRLCDKTIVFRSKWQPTMYYLCFACCSTRPISVCPHGSLPPLHKPTADWAKKNKKKNKVWDRLSGGCEGKFRHIDSHPCVGGALVVQIAFRWAAATASSSLTVSDQTCLAVGCCGGH